MPGPAGRAAPSVAGGGLECSRSRRCSRAPHRPAEECCGSTASASPRSRGRSPTPAGTATGSRPRSVRATSRSTSTSSSSQARSQRARRSSAFRRPAPHVPVHGGRANGGRASCSTPAACAGSASATAESCTGGLVAARLTDIAGSSDVFAGSVVAYATTSRSAELGVSEALLAEHGAVSAEVAEAMAEGIRARLGVDVGIAVTGVAGPGGGTDDKPVGLVHFHVATRGGATQASSRCPPTATRSARGPRWPRCTSRDAF